MAKIFLVRSAILDKLACFIGHNYKLMFYLFYFIFYTDEKTYYNKVVPKHLIIIKGKLRKIGTIFII